MIAPESPAWLTAVAVREQVEVSQIRVLTIARPVRQIATLWTRGRADRRFRARFFLRRSAGRIATSRLGRDVQVVYAASLTGLDCFGAAHRHAGVRYVLVEDLPDLRTLHDDLDAAARAHPDAAFLRRYRADRSTLARQAAERLLADEILVRSHYAHDERRRLGLAAPIGYLDPGPIAGTRRPVSSAPTILLAGLAAARHGLAEALAALDACPTATLVLHVGEALEPADALDHPRVRRGTPSEIENLEGIDLVIAPAWCEVHLPQLELAAAQGIPSIATDRAAGMVTIAAAGVRIAAGDTAGLGTALVRLLSDDTLGEP